MDGLRAWPWLLHPSAAPLQATGRQSILLALACRCSWPATCWRPRPRSADGVEICCRLHGRSLHCASDFWETSTGAHRTKAKQAARAAAAGAAAHG